MSLVIIGAAWQEVARRAGALLAPRALPLLREAAEVVARPVTNLRQILESIERAEQNLRVTRELLAELARVGLAMEDDYRAFDIQRANFFATQVRLHQTVLRALAQVPGASAIAGRIPPPLMVEPLPLPRRFAPKGTFPDTLPYTQRLTYSGAPLEAVPTASGTAGLRGLGALPAIGAAGWAAIVIGVLAGVGLLVWLLRGTPDEAARNVVPEAQAALFRTVLEQRRQVYEDCVTSGGARPECASVSQNVVPDAPDLSIQQQERRKEEEAKTKNTAYVVLGIGVVIVGLLLLRARPPAPRTSAPARKISGLRGPRRVRDLHGPSTYNLEIR